MGGESSPFGRRGIAIAVTFVLAVPTAHAAPAAGGPSRAAEQGLPDLTTQQRYRAELGLPAGETTVRDLNARWSADDLPGALAEGAVFTADERRELEERETAGHEIAKVARSYFRGPRADAFGGVYIDHATGRTVVLVTRDQSHLSAELRARVETDDRLTVRMTRFALADLDRITDMLTARMTELRASGADLVSVGADERDNVTDVALTSNTARARALVLAALRPGDAAMVRFREAPAALTLGVPGSNSPPVKGGQGINVYQPNGSAGACTSAFVAYKRTRTDASIYVTDYYALTAGHCGPVGSIVTQADLYVYGRVDQNRFVDNGTDAARIPIRAVDQSQLVAITPTNDRFIYARQSNTDDVVGERTCMSGARSGGEKCGTLLVRSTTINAGGTTIPGERIASFDGLPGDSGGSILSNSEAKGITSCRTVYNNASRVCYTHVHTGLAQLSLTDVVGV